MLGRGINIKKVLKNSSEKKRLNPTNRILHGYKEKVVTNQVKTRNAQKPVQQVAAYFLMQSDKL